jgi:hypothetical protein
MPQDFFPIRVQSVFHRWLKTPSSATFPPQAGPQFIHHKSAIYMKHQLMVLLLLTLCALSRLTTYAQTNNLSTNSITFNYIDNARLTPDQIQTVLELAKICGLKSPAVIGTTIALPTAVRLVTVQSAERTDGRKTTFDTVTIHYSGSSEDKSKKQTTSKCLGDFWVNPPYLTTSSYTLFTINNKTVPLTFDEHIPLPLADKMLKCFEAGAIEFTTNAPNPTHITREQLQNLIDLEPANLGMNRELTCYEIFTAKQTCWIRFNYTPDKIKILSLSNIID